MIMIVLMNEAYDSGNYFRKTKEGRLKIIAQKTKYLFQTINSRRT